MNEDFLDEISLLYEALIDPAKYQEFTTLVGERYPDSGVFLWLEDKQHVNVSVGAGFGSEDDWLLAYEQHYATVNPWTEVMMSKPAGHVHNGDLLVPRDDFIKTEFYNDWMLPQGFSDGFGLNVLVDSRQSMFFSVCVAHGLEAGKRELDYTKALLPHLQRSARIYQHLSRVTHQNALFEELLDRIPLAVFILDENQRVYFANGLADEICCRQDGLLRVGERLAAEDPLQSNLLQGEILAASNFASGFVDPRAQGEGFLSITRTNKSDNYQAYVLPLAGQRMPISLAMGREKPMVAVIIKDPEQHHETPLSFLAKAYGLTQGEALLVQALVNGLDTKAAAQELGITNETARSRLKTIFAKMDVNRQTELIRKVMLDFVGLRQGG